MSGIGITSIFGIFYVSKQKTTYNKLCEINKITLNLKWSLLKEANPTTYLGITTCHGVIICHICQSHMSVQLSTSFTRPNKAASMDPKPGDWMFARNQRVVGGMDGIHRRLIHLLPQLHQHFSLFIPVYPIGYSSSWPFIPRNQIFTEDMFDGAAKDSVTRRCPIDLRVRSNEINSIKVLYWFNPIAQLRFTAL